MRFVLDENLPPRMARILRELEEESPHEVVHLAADLHLRGVSDEEWFARLDPNHRWAILTHDSGIKKNPHELAAWKNQGHIVFFFARGWQSQPLNELAWRLLRWWPEIVRTAERANRGDAYFIPFQGAPGKIEKLEARQRRRRRN